MFSKVNRTKIQEGFTIIEVMIVLAIAGLIMGIVLVAIPQLQRNQRNEARKNVLARISAEVNNYVGNNEGLVPINAATPANTSFIAGFLPRYVNNAPAGTFDRPGGGPFTYSSPTGTLTTVAQDAIVYRATAVCVGELPGAINSGNARNFAIAVGLEGGASFCVDNQ